MKEGCGCIFLIAFFSIFALAFTFKIIYLIINDKAITKQNSILEAVFALILYYIVYQLVVTLKKGTSAVNELKIDIESRIITFIERKERLKIEFPEGTFDKITVLVVTVPAPPNSEETDLVDSKVEMHGIDKLLILYNQINDFEVDTYYYRKIAEYLEIPYSKESFILSDIEYENFRKREAKKLETDHREKFHL